MNLYEKAKAIADERRALEAKRFLFDEREKLKKQEKLDALENEVEEVLKQFPFERRGADLYKNGKMIAGIRIVRGDILWRVYPSIGGQGLDDKFAEAISIHL